MTALRFQTGEGHQTSLASLWGVHNGVTVGQALQNLHKSRLGRTEKRSCTLSQPGAEPLATTFTECGESTLSV